MNTQESFKVFYDRLANDIAHMPGWNGNVVTSNGYGVQVQFVCPHGETTVNAIDSIQLLHAPPMMLADNHFQQAVGQCAKKHLDTPLASNAYWQTPQPLSPQYMTKPQPKSPYYKTITMGQSWVDSYHGLAYQQQLIMQTYLKYGAMTVDEVYAGLLPNGSKGGTEIFGELTKIFPVLVNHAADCPVCSDSHWKNEQLGRLIPHINDTHKWKREKIADWLETLNVDLSIKPKGKVDNGKPSIGTGKQEKVFAGFGEWSKWVGDDYPF